MDLRRSPAHPRPPGLSPRMQHRVRVRLRPSSLSSRVAAQASDPPLPRQATPSQNSDPRDARQDLVTESNVRSRPGSKRRQSAPAGTPEKEVPRRPASRRGKENEQCPIVIPSKTVKHSLPSKS